MKSNEKNNIFYSLNESDYKTEVTFFNGKVVIFHFSSMSYKKKFDSRLKAYAKSIEKRIQALLGGRVEVNMDISLAAFRLYTIIETRGFYVIDYYGKPVDKIMAVFE